jgi:hypothetical protein
MMQRRTVFAHGRKRTLTSLLTLAMMKRVPAVGGAAWPTKNTLPFSGRDGRFEMRGAEGTLMLLLILAMLLGTSPVRAESCALPTESELGSPNPPPEPSWTPQEKWVWQRTLADEIADFNELYCEQLDSKTAVDAWQAPDKPRRLSERFLLDVLTKPPFVEAVPRLGIRVIGAWFPMPLDLSSIEFKRRVWLRGSRFDGPVSLVRSKMESVVSFASSTFEAALDMASLETGNLFLRDGTFKGDVRLLRAKVGGNLQTDHATFEAALDMASLETGDDLFLRDGTFKGQKAQACGKAR